MKLDRSQFTQSFVPSGSGSIQRNPRYNQGHDVIIDTSGQSSADYSLDGCTPSRWSSAIKDFQKANLPQAPKKQAKKK